MIVDELVAVLGFDVQNEDDLRRFKDDLRGASQQLDRFAARAVEAGRAAAIAFGAIGGAIGAAFGKSIIDVNAQFETFRATLITIEGSAAAAEKSLDWIARFAKTTPYEVSEVTEAFVRLRAYGIDPMDGTLTALGDTAASMGKPLMAAVEALADAASGEFERMKEFGIRASVEGDKVTFSWQRNGKEFRETIAKNGAAITKFLKDTLGGRFEGAMLRQSKTWTGLVSNLSDSWVDFQRRIGEGGFFETVKNRLADLLDHIAQLDADGTLDRWSQNLSDAFTAVADGVVYMARQIKSNLDTLSRLYEENRGKFEEIFGPMKALLVAIAIRLFPMVSLFSLMALALNDFLKYMEGADSILGRFIQTISDFLGVEPERVAEVLGDIAQAAGWFAAASIGVSLFAGAIRSLAGALVLLKPLRWVAPWLAGLAGIQWGATAAGAGAAGAAGTAAAGAGASGWLSGAARLFAGWGAVLAAMPGLFTGNQIVDIPDEHEPDWMKELKKEWGQETPNAIRNGNKLLHGALEYIGEKVSDLVTLFTQDASAAPFAGGGSSGGGLYSPSGIPLGGGHQSSYKGGTGKDALMQGVYNAFRNAGYSHEGAKAMVAEVGRENSFRESLVFGSHLDPHNNRRNSGFFSWQKDRGDKLMAFLGARGLVKGGKIQRSQASLDAMAEFTAKEMGRMTPGLLRDLRSGNISYAEANERLGEDYIKWRYNDPRYARHHGYRDQYYARISELTDGEVSQMAQNYAGHARRMNGSGRSLQASIANNNSRSSQVNQTIHVGDVHAAPGERVERATARAVGNAAASAGTKPLARIQQGPASP